MLGFFASYRAMNLFRDLFKSETVPKSDQKAPGFLYRYMSIAKFIDFLDRQEFFLCKSTQLPDKAEGLKQTAREKARAGFLEVLQRPNDSGAAALKRLKLDLEERDHEFDRELTYVNCWHRAQDESFAMWRIYMDNTEGVCIRTTPDRLEAIVSDAQPADPARTVILRNV